MNKFNISPNESIYFFIIEEERARVELQQPWEFSLDHFEASDIASTNKCVTTNKHHMTGSAGPLFIVREYKLTHGHLNSIVSIENVALTCIYKYIADTCC